jgi:peptidoglycan-associated lipoprotein
MISLNYKSRYPKRTIQIVLLGIAVFYFVGCSSTKPAAKPEETAQTQKPAEDSTKGQKNAPVGQSSMDQAQRGGKVGTPAESPLKDVYFDFDRYDLREDARATLKANAEWLKKNASATVQIEGHCDERGTAEYNLALGAKRAQAAKDYLTTLGVAEPRLTTISYGQELPVCTEHNEDCWQKNRHDRFVIKSGPTA